MWTQGEGRQRGEEGEGKSSLYGDEKSENYEAITPNEQFCTTQGFILHAALDIVIESQSVRFPMHLLVYVLDKPSPVCGVPCSSETMHTAISIRSIWTGVTSICLLVP